MYAVVESGGKQYRVEEGTVLVVDRLEAEAGDKVSLRPVLVSGDSFVVKADELAKIKIEATVTGHERGEKIKVFKYKPKKGYSRRAGHRAELTRLEITSLGGAKKKAAPKKAAAKADETKAASAGTAEKKPAAKKPAAKKPAAKKDDAEKKPAAKKPAAKKPAAKKDEAAKKPAAKKPAAKKPAAEKTEDKTPKEDSDGA